MRASFKKSALTQFMSPRLALQAQNLYLSEQEADRSEHDSNRAHTRVREGERVRARMKQIKTRERERVGTQKRQYGRALGKVRESERERERAIESE